MAETNKTSREKSGHEADFDSPERRNSSVVGALDAKLSGLLAPFEESLDDVFGSKAQYQLPENIKMFIVKIAPWLALFSGLFGIFSAYWMWQAVVNFNRVADDLDYMYGSLGMAPAQTASLSFSFVFWQAIVTTLLFVTLSLLAFPGLKARKKIGWNLMFYSTLAYIAYSVVMLFYSAGGLNNLLGAVVSTAIGLYLLFQIRSHYTVR